VFFLYVSLFNCSFSCLCVSLFNCFSLSLSGLYFSFCLFKCSFFLFLSPLSVLFTLYLSFPMIFFFSFSIAILLNCPFYLYSLRLCFILYSSFIVFALYSPSVSPFILDFLFSRLYLFPKTVRLNKQPFSTLRSKDSSKHYCDQNHSYLTCLFRPRWLSLNLSSLCYLLVIALRDHQCCQNLISNITAMSRGSRIWQPAIKFQGIPNHLFTIAKFKLILNLAYLI